MFQNAFTCKRVLKHFLFTGLCNAIPLYLRRTLVLQEHFALKGI